jgi:ATP-dependent exoDNAse (exonuclease V) alpha subunit
VTDSLAGWVRRVVFHSGDFYVLDMHIEDPPDLSGRCVARGNLYGLVSIGQGVPIRLIGQWRKHPKYGHQLAIQSWEPWATTNEGVLAFFQNCIEGMNWQVAGGLAEIGPRALQDVPGSLEAIRQGPNPPLDSEALDRALLSWERAMAVRDLAGLLKIGGIGATEIQAAMVRFGMEAPRVIRANPYRLMEVISDFPRVDKLAVELGFRSDAPERITGAVLWALRESTLQGHLYLRRGDLSQVAEELFKRHSLLPLGNSSFDEATDILVGQKAVVLESGTGVYLPSCYDFERNSARLLASLLAPANIEVDLQPFLAGYEKSNRVKLSDDQRQAVEQLAKNRVLVLTGLPGTGKTTAVRALVKLFEEARVSFVLMAPTGIAAKRLSYVTGHEASTIHRALKYDGMKWGYGPDNRYVVDAVIVDEMCLPYKQPVDLADGTRRYIGTVVNQKQPVEVLSYDSSTGRVEPRKVVGWFKYPSSSVPLYEVHCSLAKSRHRRRILRCTGRHKVYLSSGGRKAASTLRVGDCVMVRGTFLNPTQRSFLLGSLLGDACLGGKPSGRRVQFTHGQEQEAYLRFKAKLFRCADPYPSAGGYKREKGLWHCYSPIIDDLDDVYPLVYPDGIKTVTNEWLDQVDPIGLAAWYMDDGSLSVQMGSSPAVLLHTEGFDRDQCETLKEWLQQKWAIEASVYSNGQRGHFYLRLTCASSKVFWSLVAPWIHPSLAYKLPQGIPFGSAVETLYEQSYRETSGYPVQAVKRFSVRANTRKFVYDIEVEGNHNYFSNGTLVSNSMVDQELFYRLLSALRPDTILVLVGDDAQLPSVGPGNVLRELVACEQIPSIRLTQIFRQAAKGEIVQNSHRINRGEMPLLPDSQGNSEFCFVRLSDEDRIVDLVVDMAEKLKARNANFQVLAPKYEGVVGVNYLNERLRDRLNPEGPKEWKQDGQHFRLGDRLMVVKNDYERGVYNGDMGKLVAIESDALHVRIHGLNERDLDMEVEFPSHLVGDKLRLAYAVSVHKSQGSEFDTIVLPIVRAQGRMLQRNLLYTAVTRARKRVWLIGEESAIQKAIQNNKVVRRNTVFAQAVAGVVTQDDDRTRRLVEPVDPGAEGTAGVPGDGDPV